MPEANLDALRTELLEYIDQRLHYVQIHGLTWSHLSGVGHRSITLFERLFRQVVANYFARYSVSYNDDVRHRSSGKPFDKLTLGQLIDCLRQMEQVLAERDHTAKPSKRFLPKSLESDLSSVTRSRAVLFHPGADDLPREQLVEEVSRVLVAIRRTVSDPLFELKRNL